jgi:hypothetical protein
MGTQNVSSITNKAPIAISLYSLRTAQFSTTKRDGELGRRQVTAVGTRHAKQGRFLRLKVAQVRYRHYEINYLTAQQSKIRAI